MKVLGPTLCPGSFERPRSSQSLLLPVLILLAALRTRFRGRSRGKSLLPGLQEDVRDNILNYDEQGGGEEDQVRRGVVVWTHGTLGRGPQNARSLLEGPLATRRSLL